MMLRSLCRSLMFVGGNFMMTIICPQAWAADTTAKCANAICIEQAWMRATPAGAQNAAVYFSLANKGDAEDTLVSVTTPAAALAMVHRTTLTGNIVRMEAAAHVAVLPHSHLVLGPRGYHVMLMGLTAQLKQGMTIPLTLNFAGRESITTDVPVLGVAALGPGSPPTSVPADAAAVAHPHH